MKKNILFPLGMLLLAMPMKAQDIYKMETMSTNDLNGTARYVGMGGAMNALGADLSTMGVNPAGIGMYRRSDIALTGSLTSQPNAHDFYDIGKTRGSFDQMGFVYAAKIGDEVKFVNFGFNYHKRRNMKNFIGINNFATGGLSQSLQMLDLAYVNDGWLDLTSDKDRELTTPLTCLGFDTQMIAPVYDAEGKLEGYVPSEAQSYSYQRAQWGGIQEYDINVSLNWNDQVYGGITFGVHNVDMHTGTFYSEQLIDPNGPQLHEYYMTNEEALTGSGYDVKLGMILRPIEESPFRIGFAVHTPTFYDLKANSYLYMNSPYRSEHADYSEADVNVVGNEYKIRTPWKINLSMATTIGNYLALDAEYEYCDLASAKVSYFDDDYGYSEGIGGWINSSKDRALNNEAKRFLNSVSTFKIGAEARLSKNVSARIGYNFVSAPVKEEAFLNLFTPSSSYYYNTNTDYVNLGEINRVTFGLGYKTKHFYADLAYLYQAQQGDVYTFHIPGDDSERNRLQGAKVDLNRHNVMLTLGYKF